MHRHRIQHGVDRRQPIRVGLLELHDRLVVAQKPRKTGQARTATRPILPGGAQGPQIDWDHVRDLAERTKGPELVITCACCDNIPGR
jgi:hypothetical protein